jgi:hypothetical protein
MSQKFTGTVTIRIFLALLAMAAAAHSTAVDIAIKPIGEYAQIDVELANNAIRVLGKGSPDEKQKVIENIKAHSENYAPPVFYALSRVLFESGNKDEAAFWFYNGQVRARFDADRCTDASAHGVVDALNAQFGRSINQYTFQDIPKLEALMPRVLDWDKKTPHKYDQRWINLSGMDAMSASMDPPATGSGSKPLSLPREQWNAIAEKTRSDYFEGFKQAVDRAKKEP